MAFKSITGSGTTSWSCPRGIIFFPSLFGCGGRHRLQHWPSVFVFCIINTRHFELSLFHSNLCAFSHLWAVHSNSQSYSVWHSPGNNPSHRLSFRISLCAWHCVIPMVLSAHREGTLTKAPPPALITSFTFCPPPLPTSTHCDNATLIPLSSQSSMNERKDISTLQISLLGFRYESLPVCA